jgi:coenzyme Q-binding protein COQ10
MRSLLQTSAVSSRVLFTAALPRTRCKRTGMLRCGIKTVSKMYQERRVVPYTSKHVFSVVSDISNYCNFLPWCTSSKILRDPFQISTRAEPAVVNVDAELRVDFHKISETYLSTVTMVPHKYIRAVSSDTKVFKSLVTEWKFRPGSKNDACEVDFFICFKFQSDIYAHISSLFFHSAVKAVVYAFEKEFSNAKYCRDE